MILVTGGTGYVGSRLVRTLVEQGRAVRLLVRDEAGARRAFPTGVTFARGDVTEPATLAAALTGVEAVIHLVAIIRERGGATFRRSITGAPSTSWMRSGRRVCAATCR